MVSPRGCLFSIVGEIKRVLKKDGVLILEVPLRIRKPFLHNEEPLLPSTENISGHYREYSVNSFKSLVSQYFSIIDLYGVNRGIYVPIENTRNAIMAVLQK